MGEEKCGKKFNKTTIGKADKWLVDEARKVGLHIDGFEHEITNEFINHVMKRHGNEKSESKQGQIAVRESDFTKILEIVGDPDFVMLGLKSAGRDMIAYAKKMSDGTTLYLEEVLAGKRNKTLRGKTMFRHKEIDCEEKFFRIISGGNYTDMANAKILTTGRRRQSGSPTI